MIRISFKHGPRLTESFHYIAEIISRFDVVAIQEVNDDLGPLEYVLDLLGPWWDYITTDTTAGSGATMSVWHHRLRQAKDTIQECCWRDRAAEENACKRGRAICTVALCSFLSIRMVQVQPGTVHLYYGADTGEKLKRRIAEIEENRKFFGKAGKIRGKQSYSSRRLQYRQPRT